MIQKLKVALLYVLIFAGFTMAGLGLDTEGSNGTSLIQTILGIGCSVASAFYLSVARLRRK